MTHPEPVVSGTALRPRLMAINPARAYSGFGRTRLYELLATGEVRAVKLGGRTLIDVQSLDDFIAALPTVDFGRRT